MEWLVVGIAGALIVHVAKGDVDEVPPGTKPIHNNSPGVLSCILAGANTGAICIRTEMNSLKKLTNMRKMILKNIFLCLRQCEYRPRMYSRKNEFPKEFFMHVLVLCRGATIDELCIGGGSVTDELGWTGSMWECSLEVVVVVGLAALCKIVGVDDGAMDHLEVV